MDFGVEPNDLALQATVGATNEEPVAEAVQRGGQTAEGNEDADGYGKGGESLLAESGYLTVEGGDAAVAVSARGRSRGPVAQRASRISRTAPMAASESSRTSHHSMRSR